METPMQTPSLPKDEALRLRCLLRLELLDSPREAQFDRLTQLACDIFNVPIALISLVDRERQWFKSAQGLTVRETARDYSFCAHAILGDTALVVEDASRDERFRGNPLVDGEPHIAFYAGHPVRAPEGAKIGTLCIIDREPRHLSERELRILAQLALLVESEIAMHRQAIQDELTRLLNRRGFALMAGQVLHQLYRIGMPVSVLFLDLDGVRHLNERFGHGEGDRALRQCAEALGAVFRASDLCARIGGDEFAVLLADADEGSAAVAAGRLHEALLLSGRSAALGWATSHMHECPQLDDLLLRAEQAMHRAKKGGA